MKTCIMKFGGAAMGDIERFPKLAALIENRKKEYTNVVVVVSAMGQTTNELMLLAKKVHPNPPKREQDMLITVGERVSSALLAMALQNRGIDAISYTGSQSGIITTDDHSDAQILEVRPDRIKNSLAEGKVVIVAGFQGMSTKKEITTLGRGGSDTSAVALAAALKADKVEFYKDVAGIGATNPKTDPLAKIFPTLTYAEALGIIAQGAKVLHDRCVTLAQKEKIPLEIRFFENPESVGTYVS